MTDQTARDVTDDDRRIAREWASNVRRHADKHFPAERAIARVILNAVPSPPRPTLADMTPEERAACQWMQADTKLWGRVVIIVPDLSDGRAALLDQSGDVIYGRYVNVTPRPDLPRMTWPGDKKPAHAPALPDGWRLADHVTHGRVIVTNSTPDTEGHVYFVAPDPDPTGHDWHLCFPDRLTYIDTEPEAADATD